MMIITERKHANYSLRVGEKRFVEGNGKSLVTLCRDWEYNLIGFLTHLFNSVKIALPTLQSVQHGKTELKRKPQFYWPMNLES